MCLKSGIFESLPLAMFRSRKAQKIAKAATSGDWAPFARDQQSRPYHLGLSN
jgi:hypothetical protein